MDAGCAGAVMMFSANVCAVPVPQLLFAATEIVPPVVVAVVLIVLVVDVPLHPEGNVQV